MTETSLEFDIEPVGEITQKDLEGGLNIREELIKMHNGEVPQWPMKIFVGYKLVCGDHKICGCKCGHHGAPGWGVE